MPNNDCLPHVHSCAMRVCRLDSNGVPTPGDTSLYVSDALVSFEWKANIVEGDEIIEKNACGEIKVNYRGRPSLKRGDVTVTLLTPDPRLSEMLSNGEVLGYNAGGAIGTVHGYAAPEIGIQPSKPVSIELWAKRISDGRLDDDLPYAWWAYPWIDNLRPGDHTHSQSNLGAVFVGESYENLNWYDGPLNDWPATSDRAYQWVPTASVPTPSCGYRTVAAS